MVGIVDWGERELCSGDFFITVGSWAVLYSIGGDNLKIHHVFVKNEHFCVILIEDEHFRLFLSENGGYSRLDKDNEMGCGQAVL
jgi:hypothetical protein